MSTNNRHPIDRLRVQCWFGYIKHKTSFTSAYQVEKRFESLRRVKKDVRTPFSNKWVRYAEGEHTPRPELVAEVEAEVQGSASLLNHPLWELLKADESELADRGAWLQQLDSRTHRYVLTRQTREFTTVQSMRACSPYVIDGLLGFDTLDSLAALFLYWLDAEKSLFIDKHRRMVANAIYRMLLILGTQLHRIGVAEQTFLYFRDLVFRNTPWTEGEFGVEPLHFVASSFLLREFAERQLSVRQRSKRGDFAKAARSLLKGKHGEHYELGLGVFLTPNWQSGQPTEREKVAYMMHYRAWESARTRLLEEIADHPNETFRKFIDEHFRVPEVIVE